MEIVLVFRNENNEIVDDIEPIQTFSIEEIRDFEKYVKEEGFYHSELGFVKYSESTYELDADQERIVYMIHFVPSQYGGHS